MPPIRNKNIQNNRIGQEGLIEQVIRDLKSSKISSIRKAATIYGIAVVYSTIIKYRENSVQWDCESFYYSELVERRPSKRAMDK